MINHNTALALQMSSTETAVDDGGRADWFADLTWSQILPIALLVMTLFTGLMCVSAFGLTA